MHCGDFNYLLGDKLPSLVNAEQTGCSALNYRSLGSRENLVVSSRLSDVKIVGGTVE